MKSKTLILALLLSLSAATVVRAGCGDDGLTCGEEESCCEHVMAMFSEDHPIAPPYIQGQCVPKGQKCTQFWCGNRNCQAGFFGTPSVCCVNRPEKGSTSQYSCAYNELSCPGNSQQLTIRDNTPNRTLQRG